MPSNVIERHGKFAARVTPNGRQLWLGTYVTREDAEAAIADFWRFNPPKNAARQILFTVAEWADCWALLYPGARNPQTALHNARMIAPFVREYGPRQIRSITEMEAQAWAIRSPGSVRYLRMMWRRAVKANVAVENPWGDVEISQTERAKHVPSAVQVDLMAAAAKARGWASFAGCIVFTAYTGLRVGEVADVSTGDVREDGRRLLVRGKRRAGEAAPRQRVVAVFPPARAVLLAHAPDIGLVWRSVQDRRLTQDTVSRMFGRVREDVGFLGTFHSLRRFHASWLADQGADARDIAMQLGHTDRWGRPYPELVNRVYAHPAVEPALARLEAVAG
jgi:Phage integrase family